MNEKKKFLDAKGAKVSQKQNQKDSFFFVFFTFCVFCEIFAHSAPGSPCPVECGSNRAPTPRVKVLALCRLPY